MFEQNSREAEGKKESLQGLSNAKDEARAEVRAIRNENYTLKAKLRQQQVQSEEAVKMLKRKHELEVSEPFLQTNKNLAHMHLRFNINYTTAS